MTRGPASQPHTITQIFAQYISKHVPNTELEPIDWRPNPTISRHRHQHESHYGIAEINCTETSSIYQQQHLSGFLSSFYDNYSTQHEPLMCPTPCSPCVTHDNDDSIKTFLTPEPLTHHITEFSK